VRILGSGHHTEIINYPVIIALVSSLKLLEKSFKKVLTRCVKCVIIYTYDKEKYER